MRFGDSASNFPARWFPTLLPARNPSPSWRWVYDPSRVDGGPEPYTANVLDTSGLLRLYRASGQWLDGRQGLPGGPGIDLAFAPAALGPLLGDPKVVVLRDNDLLFTDAGTALMVFRGNAIPFRDIWSLRGPAGQSTFTGAAMVSSTAWESYICPMEGPRAAQLGDATLLTAWADPTAGPWRIWTARSTDDAQSWSGDAMASDSGGDQRQPDLAADGNRAWLTLRTDAGFTLLESVDGGASFAELEALNSGGTDMDEPQVEARDGVALVVGANSAGQVWLRRL